jgi:hypothetical protein
MPPEGGIAKASTTKVLDADAELAGLLLAGTRIRVKVIGRAVTEAIAVAQLSPDKDANGGDGKSYGKPSNDAQDRGSSFLKRVFENGQLRFKIGRHGAQPPSTNMIPQIVNDEPEGQIVGNANFTL